MNIIRHSLMNKYLLLIITAIVIWPLFPAIYYFLYIWVNPSPFYEAEELDHMWKHAAVEMDGAASSVMNRKLDEIQDRYPEAEMFWVDGSGETQFVHQRLEDIPAQWTFNDSVAFYENLNAPEDIYTVTAAIGQQAEQGFMVFQIPIKYTTMSMVPLFSNSLLNILFIMACGAIVIFSWLFFLKLRKRLVQLQAAMTDTGESGVPNRVAIRKRDEIGHLETSFNNMVDQLKRSREREQEEVSLRNLLIANVSHDLRTPLTVIRQHAYVVQKNPTSPQGITSMKVIVKKLGDVSMLIDNLLSHTLLSAGKYPLRMKNIDVMEEVRNAIAEWYPIFEKEGFEVEVDIPEEVLCWYADPLWLRSILDNLFQNVIRHAKSGGYVGIQFIERKGLFFLEVKDKGSGMSHQSQAKGAGIGLSIVSLMAKDMDMKWEIESSSAGTSVYVGKEI